MNAVSWILLSGAPAAWTPPPSIEMHRPLIFLNIKNSTGIAGLQAMLNEENSTSMLALPLIHQASDEVHVIALWDPSIHESIHLYVAILLIENIQSISSSNQITPTDTVIYLIVKVNVLITEPAQMELILRKRIAVTISKTERWWPGKVFREILNDVNTISMIEIINNSIVILRNHVNIPVLSMKLSRCFREQFKQ